ncbi:hypothetical protein VNI00_009477 [Paramarasmius palmivorus]|uniref:Uncharacterized protein n=1 Tax=Paramarasmius palmivorus TaxID=297713 RepID=A0AAW0CP88_9AGAR
MSSKISGSSYAQRRKELLTLVNQLRAVGAQSDLDLPRITIIGNQSAGKSSVVEAISGVINLPRDAGTCTRCPIECRLSSTSGTWRCHIKIRQEYDEQGKRLAEIKEVPFGSTILSREEVEPTLRKAQFAVLNPRLDKKTVLSTSVDQLDSLPTNGKSFSFSRNVVCVDLEGPELTDLSFIDLPGIIQNAPDDETIRLVEELVLSHTQGNCLILVALPMTDDIENQKALRLARQVDPTGQRTIGVMTKPDMLGPGSRKALDLWVDVIEGRRHPLVHGYYCTRQPNDDERSKGVSPAQARSLEEHFFKETLPWSKSTHMQRFGTENLTSALSRLLIHVIDQSLPGIKEEATKQLSMFRDDLSGLPVPIEEEPATYVLNEVIAFSADFDRFVGGGSGQHAQLIQDSRRAFEGLKRAIRKTAPLFVPFTKEEENPVPVDFLDGDEEEETSSNSEGITINLSDMRKHIKKSITRELPNNVPRHGDLRRLMSVLNALWSLTVGLLRELVNKRFERHVHLRNDINDLVLNLVEKHYGRCLMLLETTLEAEESPFTQNTHYLQSATDKWLSKYKTLRADRNEAVSASGTTKQTADDDSQSAKGTPVVPNGSASNSQRDERGSAPNFFKPSGPASSTSKQTDQARSPFGTAQQSPFFGKSTNSFAEPSTYSTLFPNSSTFFQTPSTSASPSNTSPFSSTFAPSKPSQPTSAAEPAPAKSSTTAEKPTPKETKELLSLLAKCGFAGVTLEDLGRLQAPDEYETEIQVMAEVRGYFQIAYKRIIDNVPNFIDLRFIKALGKDMQKFLVSELGLGSASANEKCAQYLVEDPLVAARRDDLMARVKRLESVQRELNSFRV